MISNVQVAQYIATDHHVTRKGQSYGPLPYTHHLERVANVLVEFGMGDDEELLAAAWLHDAYEDTDLKRKQVIEMFGPEVDALVWAVTDGKEGNRTEKKAVAYEKINALREAGDNRAVALKLADRIANVRTGGTMVKAYRKEQDAFRRNLRVTGEFDQMWSYLEGLLVLEKNNFLPLRVCVIGAESTGKSTLVKDLAKALKVKPVPEYRRIYTEELDDPQNYLWTHQDFVNIAERQNELEDEAILNQPDYAIFDTNAWVTSVFEEEYLGNASATVEKLGWDRHYDLMVVTPVDNPFEQDHTGLRNLDARHRMHDAYMNYIDAKGFDYIEVNGSREVRLNQARSRICLMLKWKREGLLYFSKYGHFKQRR